MISLPGGHGVNACVVFSAPGSSQTEAVLTVRPPCPASSSCFRCAVGGQLNKLNPFGWSFLLPKQASSIRATCPEVLQRFSENVIMRPLAAAGHCCTACHYRSPSFLIFSLSPSLLSSLSGGHAGAVRCPALCVWSSSFPSTSSPSFRGLPCPLVHLFVPSSVSFLALLLLPCSLHVFVPFLSLLRVCRCRVASQQLRWERTS